MGKNGGRGGGASLRRFSIPGDGAAKAGDGWRWTWVFLFLSELNTGAAPSFCELHEDGVALGGRGSTQGEGRLQSESRGLGL